MHEQNGKYLLYFFKLNICFFLICTIPQWQLMDNLNYILGPDGPLGPKGEKGSIGEWGDFGVKGYRVCSHMYIIYIFLKLFIRFR